MAHFYLTLPSNSSLSYYPENTLTTFTTRLANPIKLQGDWECALVEISFPRNWYTVPRHGRFFYINTRDEGPQGVRKWKLYINAGYYLGVEEVVARMNATIQTFIGLYDPDRKAPRVSYNEKQGRIQIHLLPRQTFSCNRH